MAHIQQVEQQGNVIHLEMRIDHDQANQQQQQPAGGNDSQQTGYAPPDDAQLVASPEDDPEEIDMHSLESHVVLCFTWGLFIVPLLALAWNYWTDMQLSIFITSTKNDFNDALDLIHGGLTPISPPFSLPNSNAPLCVCFADISEPTNNLLLICNSSNAAPDDPYNSFLDVKWRLYPLKKTHSFFPHSPGSVTPSNILTYPTFAGFHSLPLPILSPGALSLSLSPSLSHPHTSNKQFATTWNQTSCICSVAAVDCSQETVNPNHYSTTNIEESCKGITTSISCTQCNCGAVSKFSETSPQFGYASSQYTSLSANDGGDGDEYCDPGTMSSVVDDGGEVNTVFTDCYNSCIAFLVLTAIMLLYYAFGAFKGKS